MKKGRTCTQFRRVYSERLGKHVKRCKSFSKAGSRSSTKRKQGRARPKARCRCR